MATSRIEYIDFAKAIAIIFVIIGHCFWIKEFPLLHKGIYSFHMPLFFIISGYFSKELPLKVSVRKFFKSYIIPLVITSLISLLIVLIGDVIRKDSLQETIMAWSHILYTMMGNQDALNVPRISPLWFLMALFWGSVAFSQILKLKKYDQVIVAVSGLVGVTCLVAFIHPPLMIEEGILSVFYLWIGRTIRDKGVIDNKNISILGWCLTMLIWMASVPCGPFFFKGIYLGRIYIAIIGSIAASIVILKMCSLLEWKINGGWIGRNTLSILCGHVISFNFLKLLGFQWEKINTPPIFLRFAIEILIMISLSLIIGWGLSQIKPFKKEVK